MDFKGFLDDRRTAAHTKAATRYSGLQERKLDGQQNFRDYMLGSSSDEAMPDAASEKDLGNEYYKQKKYKEAIDCYSRSIALSPTSVAFANRAVSYLKLKRFVEAEDDCTEALSLDDRYVKAYSRRSTARKELGKLKEAMEDADFAVRLEPNNKELQKLYDDTKALYIKETAKKPSGPTHRSASADKDKVNLMKADDAPTPVVELINRDTKSAVKLPDQTFSGSQQRQAQQKAMQDLVSRAASIYMANSDRSVVTPKSAYEFEVAWRALSDDVAKQAALLKSIDPSALPQIFKNALSAAMLVDIVKCTATFIQEEMELAVKILDNLRKVPRFDMIVMCLSPLDQSEMRRLWDEALLAEGVGMEQVEALTQLKPRYILRTWRSNGFAS